MHIVWKKNIEESLESDIMQLSNTDNQQILEFFKQKWALDDQRRAERMAMESTPAIKKKRR